jgi:hypothetical protein
MKTSAFTGLVYFLAVAAVLAQPRADDVGAHAREAAHVAVARVADVTSRFDTNAFGDRLIYSDVLVEVSETLKGTPTNVLTVTVEGGEIGTLALHVSDMPVMRRGDRVLCFLDRSKRGEWVPHRRGLGLLKMDSSGRMLDGQLTLTEARTLVQSALR